MHCDAYFDFDLYRIGEETADLVCRVLLHRFRDMPVGVEGKSGAIVTENAGECFDVHTVLEGKRGECVLLWHNKDKSENSVFAMG